MESRAVFLFGVLFLVACSVISVSCGGDWMAKMKKCGDGEINIEEAFKGKKECNEQYKDAEERRRRRSPMGGGCGGWNKNLCAMICQFKKAGMLDDSGKFSESGAQEYVNKVYPESKRTDAFKSFKGCADENSSTFSMDDKCKGYQKFKKCIFQGHFKVCGIEWGGKGKGSADEE